MSDEGKSAAENVRRLNRVYAVLSAVRKSILRERNFDAMLNAACHIAVEQGGLAMAWIGMARPGIDSLDLAAHAGATPDTLAVIERLVTKAASINCSVTFSALKSGGAAVCNDIANDPAAANWRDAALSRGYLSMVSLPLKVRDAVRGTLNLYAREIHFFDKTELSLLCDLASDIGFALELQERERERTEVEAALRRSEQRLHQVQKLDAIGQLAGGVAHDFNNILMIIQGFASLLRMDTLSPDGQEAVREIIHAAERAAKLTRQLLAFGRKQVMLPEVVDLNETIRGLGTLLERVLGENIRLLLNLEAGALTTRVDAGMLDQVIMNLVLNARDAMPRGGELRIATFRASVGNDRAAGDARLEPGAYVGLRVCDTGTGIAPESLSHIFEPFYTTKKGGEGTGLGLATVYGIVSQHRGTVLVRSVPKAGSEFEVWLPATKASPTRKAGVRTAAVARAAKAPEDTHILLVEDDPHVRALTRTVLERAGYRVHEASHGPEALRVWSSRAGQIDLLLTDMVMPEGLSGRELASELKKHKADLRVVFMSGYSPDVAGRELTETERAMLIQKPLSPEEMLQAIHRALQPAQARSARAGGN